MLQGYQEPTEISLVKYDDELSHFWFEKDCGRYTHASLQHSVSNHSLVALPLLFKPFSLS